MRRGLLAAACLAAVASAAAAPTPTPSPRSGAAPLDFSGTWALDARLSVNVSPKMKNAVLIVEQRGNRITISPPRQRPGRVNLSAEELVVDGQPYEKAVGGGKGIVTAHWSADGEALEIESTSPPENPRKAAQTSRWTLSADRSTWVRETRTVSDGKPSKTRLVFRRQPSVPVRKTAAAAGPARK